MIFSFPYKLPVDKPLHQVSGNKIPVPDRPPTTQAAPLTSCIPLLASTSTQDKRGHRRKCRTQSRTGAKWTGRPAPRRPALASRTPATVSARPQDRLLAEPKLRLTFLYGPGFPESARPQLPHAPTKVTCSRGHRPRPRYTKARCFPARYPGDRPATERREGQGTSGKIQTAQIEKRRFFFWLPLVVGGGSTTNIASPEIKEK